VDFRAAGSRHPDVRPTRPLCAQEAAARRQAKRWSPVMNVGLLARRYVRPHPMLTRYHGQTNSLGAATERKTGAAFRRAFCVRQIWRQSDPRSPSELFRSRWASSRTDLWRYPIDGTRGRAQPRAVLPLMLMTTCGGTLRQRAARRAGVVGGSTGLGTVKTRTLVRVLRV